MAFGLGPPGALEDRLGPPRGPRGRPYANLTPLGTCGPIYAVGELGWTKMSIQK
jgi:hypothetical protein